MGDSQYLRRLLAASCRAFRLGISVEQAELQFEDEPIDIDAVLERINANLERSRPSDSENIRDYAQARVLFLSLADRTLRRLIRDTAMILTPLESAVFGLVVQTDGSRPSLLITGDGVDSNQPFAHGWGQSIAENRASLQRLACAVGRIQPDGGGARRYFGTGWVVDSGRHLVMTNAHVVKVMLKNIANFVVSKDRGFSILPGGAYIDFAGHTNSMESKLYSIVEAIPWSLTGTNFSTLDIALLRIEPLNHASIPPAIPLSADRAGPLGRTASFCLIGYPGAPSSTLQLDEGVDWVWIVRTLFNNRFGIKRLAPGIVHRPLGTVMGDERPWVFGHDATTLCGSSGSPALSWKDPNIAGFGIHFAGQATESNYAHAFASCRPELHTLGMSLVDGV